MHFGGCFAGKYSAARSLGVDLGRSGLCMAVDGHDLILGASGNCQHVSDSLSDAKCGLPLEPCLAAPFAKALAQAIRGGKGLAAR